MTSAVNVNARALLLENRNKISFGGFFYELCQIENFCDLFDFYFIFSFASMPRNGQIHAQKQPVYSTEQTQITVKIFSAFIHQITATLLAQGTQ